jgi:D-alanyl-D-alanine carboxypeptidase/D-alanyl-D-alanine-endopeptidase (penicillin-binding protein 4)
MIKIFFLILVFFINIFSQVSTQYKKSDSSLEYPKKSVYQGNQEKELTNKIIKFLFANKYSLNGVSAYVKDLEKDSIVLAINKDSLFNPASCSKLITAAVSLEKLGTDYCFDTKAYVKGKFIPDSGICRGDFYIRGEADPFFVAERMWLFVQHLYCMGLKIIEGDLILDDSFFDSSFVGPGFEEDETSNPYVAHINALSTNFNCISVWIRPASKEGYPVFYDIFPKTSILKIMSSAQTTSCGKPVNCIVTTKKYNDKTQLNISGTLPLDAITNVQYVKIWQTVEYTASVFENLFKDNGIQIKGKIKTGYIPDSVKSTRPFYVFQSLPLKDIITLMNKISNNFMAEMIFKTLSASGSNPGTWQGSSDTVIAWWKQKNLLGEPKIKNGSGMGNSNKLSASQFVDLLKYIYNNKTYYPEILYSLPIAGVDGTLKSRFKKSKLKGVLRAKTGTLNDYGVSTIAGYVLYPQKTMAFAVFFNKCKNKTLPEHWDIQEKILEMIFE